MYAIIALIRLMGATSESTNDAISLFAVSVTVECGTMGEESVSVIAMTFAPVFETYSVALTIVVV